MSHVQPVNLLINGPCALCIRDLLEVHARRAPDAVAVVAPGRVPLTYGRLREHVEDTVKRLNELGVGRQDRLALVLPNGPEMMVAFAAAAAGATCAPLNPAYRAEEFDFYLSDLNARALLVQAGMPSPAVAVAEAHKIPVIELSLVPEAEAGIFVLEGAPGRRELRAGFAEPEDLALLLHTSGTTSRPKIVPLTHRHLCLSAHNIRTALKLSERDRCLNIMPLFHIHGLVGATLASLAAGASIVCTPGFYAPQLFDWVEEFQPTWYTAVPTMHQAILERAASHREVIARSRLRFIRSCSAPLPPQVLSDLEQTFGVPVIESYGMTEAAHQVTSNPLPPHARKPGSVGLAAGPEVAVIDADGCRLPPGKAGEVVIRGGTVIQGYDGDPAAHRAAFVQGWLRTGDQGFLDEEGYLFLTGRLKEMINRGGQKISPREVDEVLLGHPAVAQAVTFAVPHARLGEEVAAAVVLRAQASATEREIRRFAAERLADFKVPRRVVFLDDIPKGPTGKLQRIGLAERLGLTLADGATPAPAAGSTPPRSPLERTLSVIWSEVLGLEPVGIHDNFFRLGGDSMLATQVITRLRETLHVELAPLDLFDAPTVAGLAAEVVRSRAKRADPGEVARLLQELDSLSDEEAEIRLSALLSSQPETAHN